MARTPSVRRPALVRPADSDERAASSWARTVEGLGRSGRWLISSALSIDDCPVDHVIVAPGAVLAVRMTRPDGFRCGRPEDPRALDDAEQAAHAVRGLLQVDDLHTRCEVIPTLIVWGTRDDAAGPGSLPTRREGPVWVLDGRRPALWTGLVDVDLLAPALRLLIHARLQRAGSMTTGGSDVERGAA